MPVFCLVVCSVLCQDCNTATCPHDTCPHAICPHSLQKEDAVVAFDCCFHPEALQMGNRYKAFRDLLVSTAIQGIEEACRLQNQVTTVSKEFHVLKGKGTGVERVLGLVLSGLCRSFLLSAASVM